MIAVVQPADVVKGAFWLIIAAPSSAAVMAFAGSPAVRKGARYVLLAAWLSCGAATLACLWLAFGRPPSSGIGNQVFTLVAIPVAVVGLVWLMLWRAARRHAYVQSLPPGLRRTEELADIERGIEAAARNLASAERRVHSWTIGEEERRRLRFEIDTLRSTIQKLEEERAKRQ